MVNDPWTKLTKDVHDELVAEYGTETEVWAKERVARVMSRIDAARPGGVRLTAEILWIRQLTAFTIPGSWIYISRRLLERLPSDEAVAFVFAHEAAHHDLGHVSAFAGWADWLPAALPAGTTSSLPAMVLARLLRTFESGLYGPEREGDADLHAVDLCLRAGYDGQRCLQALAILENEALDRGWITGVFGPERLLDPTDPNRDSLSYQAQRWIWTRMNRYMPLRERRERTAAHLERRRTA